MKGEFGYCIFDIVEIDSGLFVNVIVFEGIIWVCIF